MTALATLQQAQDKLTQGDTIRTTICPRVEEDCQTFPNIVQNPAVCDATEA